MHKRMVWPLTGILWLAATSLAPAASTEADYKSALAAAATANEQAGAIKNQWTTTAQALAEAKAAAAAGDFDTAVNDAKHAEALARASIAQAKEQAENEAWKAAKIR